MNNTNKFFVVGIMLFALYGSFSNEVVAQYYSQGSSSYSVSIDKKIRPIDVKEFKDNLYISEKIFSENEQIEFQVVVENTGNGELKNLQVKDTLPKSLSLLYFPGLLDSSDVNVGWTIPTLGGGETRTYVIRGKIDNSPVSNYANQTVKQTNRVCVSNAKVSDCDNASYYIAKQVVPTTGDSIIWFKTILGLGGLLSAVGLRKAARGY